MTREPSPLKVSPRNIDNFRQRKLSQIAKDLERIAGVSPSITAKVLMARGVPKMHNLRKAVFSIRESLKNQLSITYNSIREGDIPRPNKRRVPVEVSEYYKAVGYAQALENIGSDLDQILKRSGFEMPKGDNEFENLLHISFKDLKTR